MKTTPSPSPKMEFCSILSVIGVSLLLLFSRAQSFEHFFKMDLVLLHMLAHMHHRLLIGQGSTRSGLEVLLPGHQYALLNGLVGPGEMHIDKGKLGLTALSNGHPFDEIQD